VPTYEEWQEGKLQERFPQWKITVTPVRATAVRAGREPLSVRSADVLQTLLYGAVCDEAIAKVRDRYRF